MRLHYVLSLVLVGTTAAACGSSHKSSGCNPGDPAACSGGKVCEVVDSGGTGCFDPLVVKGQVTDLVNSTAIADALVVALDANRAPVSAVAKTDASGNYTLNVTAMRASNGVPTGSITLRADAQNYQSFPGGVRAALPINLSSATSSNGQWVMQSTLTNVGLIHLQGDTSTLLSISGTVEQPTTRVGLLVMAEQGGTGLTAIADTSGSYTIFNVPAAPSPGIAYTVNAYGRGLNYNAQQATVTLGSPAPVVDLKLKNTTTATINGNLIFNNFGTSPATSVALVVEPTYNTTLDRGESPPGLVVQIPSGASTYTIVGVPDGSYIILAAFGIDGAVRDLSGTGNTAPVKVVVQDGVAGTIGQFKLTGAIALTSIGGVAVGDSGVPIQITTTAPEFVWEKASSYSAADTFGVEVFDSFGNTVWAPLPQSGNGSGPFTATYAGDTLQNGMYYQLRIKAFDKDGFQLSQTEDLKGVFFKL